MKVVRLDDVPLVRGLEHRGGTFHSRTTAEGTPGTPGNFKFSLSRLGTDYSGPRHRHRRAVLAAGSSGSSGHAPLWLVAGLALSGVLILSGLGGILLAVGSLSSVVWIDSASFLLATKPGTATIGT